MTSEVLSNRELRRYKNQIAMPGFGLEGQEKIKMAKVIVIGAGGIGAGVMQHLVASGIGTLGIVDNNIVEEHNIHKQSVYGTSDLGKQKAIISKQKLQEQNAQVQINVHNVCISFLNADIICHNYDIIVDASNHQETNIALWSFCRQFKKPLVYGRVNELEIEIGVYTEAEKLLELIDKNQKNEYRVKESFLSSVAGLAGSLVCAEVLLLIAENKYVLQNKSNHINFLSLLS